MKRLVALVLTWMMVFCLGLPCFAEDVSNSTVETTDQVLASDVQSSDDAAYCEYFKSAYSIIDSINGACNTTNLFFSNAARFSIKDITVLASLEDPLAISSEAIEVLSRLKTCLDDNAGYYESSIDTIIRVGIYFDTLIPSWINQYHALSKPLVPEKYAYVDSLLDSFIANAQSFCDASVAYMDGTGKMPSYDETTFELIDIVYDLYVDGYSLIFSN